MTIFAACMDAIDMESSKGAHQVLSAIRDSSEVVADRKSLFAIIMKLASPVARQILEAMMKTTEFKATLMDRVYDDGVDKGREEGIEQGLAKGLLKIFQARGLAPSEEQRELIEACTDSEQMDRWYNRAITAASVADVLAG